jgi:hypothetical protein
VTPPKRKRPSLAARQRAYAREVAAYRVAVKAERRRLSAYFLAGVAAWVILEWAPDRHWLTPWVIGLAVWVMVGVPCEVARAFRGD